MTFWQAWAELDGHYQRLVVLPILRLATRVLDRVNRTLRMIIR